MNAEQERVLKALAGHHDSYYGISFVGFRTLELDTGLPRATVRDACRALRDQGLAEYQRGLFTEDGQVAGSGYAATMAGVERAFP